MTLLYNECVGRGLHLENLTELSFSHHASFLSQ